jgi:hypothetical protein
VRPDNSLSDCESEPSALSLDVVGVRHPEESLENAVTMFLGDTDPLIFETDTDLGVSRKRDAQ